MNMRMLEKYRATRQRNSALIFSLVGHALVIVWTAIWLLKPMVEQIEDSIIVEFVPPLQRIQIPKKVVQVGPGNQLPTLQDLPSSRSSGSSIPRITNKPKLEPLPLSTVVDLTPSPKAVMAELKDKSPTIKGGSGEIKDESIVFDSGRSGKNLSQQDGNSRASLGNLTQSNGGGQDTFGEGGLNRLGSDEAEIGDKLGSTIDEEDGIVRGHIRLIRLKHNMSDWWQDPTAIPSLINWLREHARSITADMKYAGGALPLTDVRIMDAPLLIMTGHDQAMSVSYQRLAERNLQTSGFSSMERAALRKYILDYNGMLFFDYCGDGGNEKSFANLVEVELRTIFPEYPMETLDVRHEIFQAYFKLKKTPVGGSAFWGTGYKGGNIKWRYIKGISVPGRLGKPRLAVVFCPLDYLCSMETAEVDSRAPLASRRSSDVYRFMTNMFIYQMRQRAAHNK
ncbi:MAG: DUF4159 domain-containing protein [Candidatus Poribacteria bacterium]|nr:DUF4159 domain-containing protein [Candidatus Poribacteria bacterium]